VQQASDWLAEWHGIEAQQSIEFIRAINGPKQPPKLAKRTAQINTMGLAFLIRMHDTTTDISARCDTYHNAGNFGRKMTAGHFGTLSTRSLDPVVSKRAGKTEA
jgi:hypothetical protein